MSATKNEFDLLKNGNIYCNSLVDYSRRKTIQVPIGELYMGSDYPIRIQSMTTIDTMDTEGSVRQSIKMIEAGCEYIRITAPSVKEAQNLENIKNELRKRGYKTPLIADIHFTPNAAELAARIVEKVRINPGNYADKKRFETIDYTENGYQNELERIREKFIPLVKICKEYGTAMRIGTNHGSLSDRILSRYGDTPLGMVESALEFLRICEDENYYNIVLSMKASNTQVMVQAYRLLCKKLKEENLKPYPMHLGVTEAGEGEDGRIKSSIGIGTLLEDGIGDTVRVSLTEDPELEAPVAISLVNRYQFRKEKLTQIPEYQSDNQNFSQSTAYNSPINPFQYFRRNTIEVGNIGNHNVPRVIADFSETPLKKYEDLKPIGYHYLPEPDKFTMTDLGADYIYTGANPSPFMLPNGLKEIVDYPVWESIANPTNIYPLFEFKDIELLKSNSDSQKFLSIHSTKLFDIEHINLLKGLSKTILILKTENEHAMPELRMAVFNLIKNNINFPIIIEREYPELSEDELQLFSATDVGGLLIDGLGDGVFLRNNKNEKLKAYNNLAFGILQAARTRMSKTEYISCPSCGRTLFDLQETTAMIRKQTDHLKGVKIGIMGCIVNGPGEMADADYGYVGIGKNKIALYRGQEVVKKSVHSDNAVNELIELIKEDGNWREIDV
ncbi:MAG: (E)-4-hydroxy-3-methylbut-2-enyl-diphosphate synthase [Bacteroidota bacterium]